MPDIRQLYSSMGFQITFEKIHQALSKNPNNTFQQNI